MQVASVALGSPSSLDLGTARARAAGPGLVPYKTSGDYGLVSFAPNVVAERRIAALKRSVWAAGHLLALAALNRCPGVCWFVTLTYVGVDDWEPKHISKATRLFRAWAKAKQVDCRYVWVAELQKRGAVHYHLLAWLPVGVTMPQWDRPQAAKQAWWPHGMSNTEKARAGIGYLMKYLSKLGQFHRFPKHLRLYGMGGLDPTGRAVRTWLNLPEWAKRSHGVGELSRRAGRLVIKDTGEVLASPWHVKRVPGGMKLTLTRDLPAPFHDGAYSTWPAAS
jgi:hypothetical protein